MNQLIAILRRDARKPVEEIARELGLTPAEVLEKIAMLEADGVVLGYQAIVDPEKTSTDVVTAVIEVKIAPERGGGFDRLAARIARFDEVKSCYLMSGGYDLLVVAEGRTLQDIARFVWDKLSTITGVLSTSTHFRLKSYKENGVNLERELPPERLAVAP
jgi:DNA-binding Lrp family transcriptional regulator